MRYSGTENFLQSFYAYAAVLIGALAIWATSGQAGARRLIDALLAEPPLFREPVSLQGASACRQDDMAESGRANSCAKAAWPP